MALRTHADERSTPKGASRDGWPSEKGTAQPSFLVQTQPSSSSWQSCEAWAGVEYLMMDLVVRHRVERSCYMIDWGEAASRCSQPATCRGNLVTARCSLFRGGPILASTYCAGPRSPIPLEGRGVAQATDHTNASPLAKTYPKGDAAHVSQTFPFCLFIFPITFSLFPFTILTTLFFNVQKAQNSRGFLD